MRVARGHGTGVTSEEVAKEFGVHPMALQKWLQRAAIDDGIRPGQGRPGQGRAGQGRAERSRPGHEGLGSGSRSGAGSSSGSGADVDNRARDPAHVPPVFHPRLPVRL